MGRNPIRPGRAGSVSLKEVAPKKWRARCRFRLDNGEYTQIERTGASKTNALNRLDDAVRELKPDKSGPLKGHDSVSRAAELWLREIERDVTDGEISGTTRDRYAYLVETVIVPSVGQLKIVECTPGRLDLFFAELRSRTTRAGRTYSAHHRRNIRVALKGVLGVAVRHGALLVNPVNSVSRIKSDRRREQPRALTLHERRDFFAWFLREDGAAEVRKARALARQRELPELLLLMIGTGLRIGEACGLRWCDVELDRVSIERAGQMVPQPILAVTGNVVRINGRGLVRNAGKTEKALRIVPLPQFVVQMLRARKPDGVDPDRPVFPSARLGWRSPEKTAAHIAQVREAMGVDWKLTSHTFRKTAATIWHEMLTPRMAADLIGHSQISTLQNIYVGRGELHPEGAAVMDAAWLDS